MAPRETGGDRASSSPQQCVDDGARIKADRGGNVQKFEHIKPTVAKLVFRDVGGRLSEPLGNGRLRETGRLAPGFE